MSSALFNRAPPSPTWPVKDIVFVSIVGSIMLAALLEWILWLCAFLFCLAKVVQKADNWSVRVLAVANMVFFVAMRCVFLPIMVVTLPLPSQVVRVFPEDVVGILQWVGGEWEVGVCKMYEVADMCIVCVRMRPYRTTPRAI
jgi:chitin synthase